MQCGRLQVPWGWVVPLEALLGVVVMSQRGKSALSSLFILLFHPQLIAIVLCCCLRKFLLALHDAMPVRLKNTEAITSRTHCYFGSLELYFVAPQLFVVVLSVEIWYHRLVTELASGLCALSCVYHCYHDEESHLTLSFFCTSKYRQIGAQITPERDFAFFLVQ